MRTTNEVQGLPCNKGGSIGPAHVVATIIVCPYIFNIKKFALVTLQLFPCTRRILYLRLLVEARKLRSFILYCLPSQNHRLCPFVVRGYEQIRDGHCVMAHGSFTSKWTPVPLILYWVPFYDAVTAAEILLHSP